MTALAALAQAGDDTAPSGWRVEPVPEPIRKTTVCRACRSVRPTKRLVFMAPTHSQPGYVPTVHVPLCDDCHNTLAMIVAMGMNS